jgi:hypothetical protein
LGNGFEEIGALSFFVGFPLVWVMTVVLIGRFGGWAKLGREYPERPQLGGHRFRFQSARMKLGARYGSCLVIGSDPAGLHVAVFFLFRPGHPPLFIPWHEVSVRNERGPTRRGVVLNFHRAPEVPFILSEKLAGKLAEASSGAFRYSPAT